MFHGGGERGGGVISQFQVSSFKIFGEEGVMEGWVGGWVGWEGWEERRGRGHS